MMKTIGRRLGDHFFARDIYAAHRKYEDKVRETILDNNRLYRALDSDKSLKVMDSLTCSAIPNLLECAGLGLAFYNNDLSFLAVTGLLGEAFRLGSRRSSKKTLEFLEKVIDFSRSMIDFADRIQGSIKYISNTLNGGEEWKE